MVEEHQPLALIDESTGEATRLFVPGHPVNVVVKSESNFYQITLNGIDFCRFNHRVDPENVTHFRVSGDAEVKNVSYHSNTVRKIEQIPLLNGLV